MESLFTGEAVERAGYDSDGNAADPGSPLCVAYSATSPLTGQTYHYAKVCQFGPDKGRLHDPRSPGFAGEGSRDGRPRYAFQKISPEAFAHYLRYLKTHNVAHLRNAERN